MATKWIILETDRKISPSGVGAGSQLLALKVPGGLVFHSQHVGHDQHGGTMSESMVFVPLPDSVDWHGWIYSTFPDAGKAET